MNLTVYRLLTRLLWLPIRLYLFLRQRQGKEDPARIRERLGYAAIPRPTGEVIWVHAASVGESVSVLPLITRLLDNYPTLHIVLTTGTVTSARMMEGKLPARCLHHYVPVDNIRVVKRFIRHWQPMLALWVESELWPNLLAEAARCCKVVMVNGRVSHKSTLFWARYPLLRKQVLRCFSLCLVQSEEDRQRLLAMEATHVKVLGNLKYDAPPLAASDEAVAVIGMMVQGRDIWLAASTHEGEEVLAAEAHKRLKQRHPSLLTIIVPRHTHRAEALCEQLRQQGVTLAVRSKGDYIKAETDIYIADTMGELGVFFRISPIVFIGASLVPKGGHNPLEAARLGCALLMGPYSYNCEGICQHLAEQGALIQVQDGEALYAALRLLFDDKARQEQMARQACAVVKDTSAVTDHYMAALQPFLATLRGE